MIIMKQKNHVFIPKYYFKKFVLKLCYIYGLSATFFYSRFFFFLRFMHEVKNKKRGKFSYRFLC